MPKAFARLLMRSQKQVDAESRSISPEPVETQRAVSVTPGRKSLSVSPARGSGKSFVPSGDQVVSTGPVQESVRHSKDSPSSKMEFFSKDQPFFWLSNSSDYPVVLDGVRYPTAEHLFQAQKFIEHRPDIAQKIRKASSPIDAIHIARTHAKDVRADWIRDGTNVSTMRMVLLTKFMQHTDLRLALLETGDAEIVHASPNDAFWGSAAPARADGRGRNMLGRAIMQTREVLRVVAGVGANSGTRTV